jgi:asparagine synthase (glutamine-hydrolysing)
VFAEARRAGIKVMLDGQGADEQLAGYHFAYGPHMASLLRRGDIGGVLRTMGERRRIHGITLAEQMIRLLWPMLPAWLRARLRRERENRLQQGWLDSPVFRACGPQPEAAETARLSAGLPTVRDIGSLCLNLTFASNLQMLLHWEDRNSMAHSIEARVPFLDHRLVEFSLALGNDHKIVGADTKRVLRTAMRGILPESVRQRRDKLGFATPEESWFRGPLRGAMVDGVEATLRRFPGLLDPAGTRAFAADMLDGRRGVDFALWRIVNLSIWGERFGVAL